MNTIYSGLSNWPWIKKSYPAKFMVIAFIGIHIPLIILSICLIFDAFNFTKGSAVLVVLGATLLATVIALFTFYQLLAPLHRSKQALEDYIGKRQLPTLPVHYNDEAGILMKEIQLTLTTLNTLMEEKRDIAAMLSHDLRTPLTQFIGLGRLIKREDAGLQLQEIGDMMIQIGEQQLGFLNGILEVLSHNDLERGRNFTPGVSVTKVAADAITNVAQQAADKHIDIKQQWNQNLTFTVNPEAFTQVFQNLLTNAIKFSNPNSTIYLNGIKRNNQLVITITDEGMGFAPEHATILFNRYTDVRKEGTAGEASTGLGLYLVRKIVEQHNGVITAHSNGVNTGASFEITMPV
ncbi:Signal transduction histidine kinase [Filimonas lacunae]|uniref:histidine kinase n=1 Tax=Filimonas lacunae TaxID=477680 RepID=A0A173MK06_9BACT|nr:HAMP domain-containing sensor histidine kinase [Filimonas lacunae]BAV07807.1 two-component sensor histidine kinase [Filimonas lacunae]SIT05042.1 Signal transduction histidine kinase [Filimonas lacunae]